MGELGELMVARGGPVKRGKKATVGRDWEEQEPAGLFVSESALESTRARAMHVPSLQ